MSGGPRPLDGLRVVDFGHYLAGPLVGMMLADHGAHITRIVAPGGERWAHPAARVLARGKHPLELDLREPAARARARALIADADVLIENFRPGVVARWELDHASLREDAPRLISCSLPGFPSDDARAGLRGWETVVSAAAGLCLPPHEGAPPQPPHLPIASVFAALIAWNCVLAALIERERSGLGQHIEVSLWEAAFEAYGDRALRLPDGVTAPSLFHAASEGNYRCADGRWVHVSLIAPRHLRWFVERCLPADLREAGMADHDRLMADGALAERLRERIAALLASAPADHWVELVNAAGVPCAVHQDFTEWLASEQAQRSGAALFGPGGRPQIGLGVSLGPARAATPPTPAPGGAGADAGPLAGVSVLDLTHILSGPTAGRILAELGAEVIKVNPPDAWIVAHTQVNSGKASVLIDLRQEASRPLLDALLERSDVLLHNFAAGVAERLGLGADRLAERHPALIDASLSAYGRPGPAADRRGWQPLAETVTGMMLRGEAEPRPEDFLVCDYGSGHLLAGGVLLALWARLRHGRVSSVHTSLTQAATVFRVLDGDGESPPSGETRWSDADGAWMVSGPPEQGADDQHPVVSIADVLRSPEATRRGLSIARDHPWLGTVGFVGPARRLMRTPARPTRAADAPGASTRAVAERLGFAGAFPGLVAAGTVGEQLDAQAVLDP